MLSPVLPTLDNYFEREKSISVPSFYPSPVESNGYIPNTECYNFLLVDDNHINLRILGRILAKLFPKSKVTEVQRLSLVELSAKLLQRYDVVFLDIDMPEVSGVDIARFVRGCKELDTVGLIAVTTRFLLQDMKLYSSVGFDYTFTKPLSFSYAYILDQVEAVLERRASHQ